MKQTEMKRALKEELWRLFDAGHLFSSLTVGGKAITAEAIEKQRSLWVEFRKRNPKR